jgi:hypothetical protein
MAFFSRSCNYNLFLILIGRLALESLLLLTFSRDDILYYLRVYILIGILTVMLKI